MTLDEALQQGDYHSAVTMLDAELRTAPDPGKLFMAMELKGFLEDFDGAIADLEALDPLLADRGIRDEFRPVLVNARTWCRRQTVPDFESRRASLGTEIPAFSMAHAEAIRLHARGDYQQAGAQLERASRAHLAALAPRRPRLLAGEIVRDAPLV